MGIVEKNTHEVGKWKEFCSLDGELRSCDAHLSGGPFRPINGNLHICVSLSSGVNFCVACRDRGIRVQLRLIKDLFFFKRNRYANNDLLLN